MWKERDGFGVCRVSDDAGSRINVGRGYVARRKCCRNNAAVHTFTVGSNLIAGTWSKFTHGRDTTQQLVERVKFSLEFGMKLCEYACSQQLAGRVVMALTQCTREFQCLFALARARCIGSGQKLIGNFGHRTDHQNRSVGTFVFYDGCDAVDCCGVFDRGAAELHYDHGSTWIRVKRDSPERRVARR